MHLNVIWIAATQKDFAQARTLFEEYAAWLDVDLCFQGFAQELATLPGAYAQPLGCLLLASPKAPADAAAGCIALRPIDADGMPAASVAEVKRLYVKPAARGTGMGSRLARRLFDEARSIGYRELKLDTLDWMTDARALYARFGFRECAPYYHNPLPGVVYMSLTLV